MGRCFLKRNKTTKASDMIKHTEGFTGPYFFVRHERWNVRVRVADIAYIESKKNYSMLFFRGGKKLLVLANLARFEKLLENAGFYRVHRAFLVNLDWVAAFDRQEIKGDDGQSIPLGKHYVDVLPKKVFLLTEKEISRP
jgi:DNA-binding LytR/AlgR family response regulator